MIIRKGFHVSYWILSLTYLTVTEFLYQVFVIS